MLTVDHCNCFILPAKLNYSKFKLDMALLCFYHISYKCFSGGPHVEKSLKVSTVSVTPLVSGRCLVIKGCKNWKQTVLLNGFSLRTFYLCK